MIVTINHYCLIAWKSCAKHWAYSQTYYRLLFYVYMTEIKTVRPYATVNVMDGGLRTFADQQHPELIFLCLTQGQQKNLWPGWDSNPQPLDYLITVCPPTELQGQTGAFQNKSARPKPSTNCKGVVVLSEDNERRGYTGQHPFTIITCIRNKIKNCYGMRNQYLGGSHGNWGFGYNLKEFQPLAT